MAGDLVELPHHHPAIVTIEDIPEHPDLDDLCAFAWAATDAEGITSMSPLALVDLIVERRVDGL